MKTIEAANWTRETEAYLFTETGEGDLRLVTGIRQDWWIVTGMCSWCCTPGTTMYVPTETDPVRRQREVAAHRDNMRASLAARRRQWDRAAKGEIDPVTFKANRDAELDAVFAAEMRFERKANRF